MISDIIFVLWFFLPAGAANVTPILVANWRVTRRYNWPIDGGRTFQGKPLLGSHKTWRGLLSGTFVAVLVVWLQQWLVTQEIVSFTVLPAEYLTTPAIVLGCLLGFGALAGDALESFFKRRMSIKSGQSWFPFDQIDYIVGAAVLSALAVPLPAILYAWAVVVWLGMHIVFTYIGYVLRLKDSPI